MQHSPIGGLKEAAFAAEEGESGALLDNNSSQLRARIEILKAEVDITSLI